MLTWRKKILKQKGAAPTELEQQVAQALFDLEGTPSELSNEVKDLWFLAAKEVVSPSQKAAIIIFVPYVKLAAYHKIQHLLVMNLDKKFNGKHVCFLFFPLDYNNKTLDRNQQFHHDFLCEYHAIVQKTFLTDLQFFHTILTLFLSLFSLSHSHSPTIRTL